MRPDAVFGLRVDYSSLIAKNKVIGDVRTQRSGVILREPEPGSPAAAKLHQYLNGNSHVITKVNGKPVSTPPEFYKEASGARRVTLTLAPAFDDGFSIEHTVVLP